MKIKMEIEFDGAIPMEFKWIQAEGKALLRMYRVWRRWNSWKNRKDSK